MTPAEAEEFVKGADVALKRVLKKLNPRD